MCTIRERVGSWEAVHLDAAYLADVRPFWETFAPDLNCGDWPPPGVTCATCEVTGG